MLTVKKFVFYIFKRATLDKTWAPGRPYSMQRSRGAAGIRWRLVEDREHGLFRRHVGCSSALLCELDAFLVRARGFLVTGFWKILPERETRCLQRLPVGRRCIQF